MSYEEEQGLADAPFFSITKEEVRYKLALMGFGELKSMGSQCLKLKALTVKIVFSSNPSCHE